MGSGFTFRRHVVAVHALILRQVVVLHKEAAHGVLCNAGAIISSSASLSCTGHKRTLDCLPHFPLNNLVDSAVNIPARWHLGLLPATTSKSIMMACLLTANLHQPPWAAASCRVLRRTDAMAMDTGVLDVFLMLNQSSRYIAGQLPVYTIPRMRSSTPENLTPTTKTHVLSPCQNPLMYTLLERDLPPPATTLLSKEGAVVPTGPRPPAPPPTPGRSSPRSPARGPAPAAAAAAPPSCRATAPGEADQAVAMACRQCTCSKSNGETFKHAWAAPSHNELQ